MNNGNGKHAPTFGNLDDWHTDESLTRDGAPLDLGGGRTLLVRRSGTRNRDFMVAVAESDATDERQQRDIYARHIVAGWSGINDAAGEPVPFTPEACVALFEYCPEVFDAVWLFATQRANYHAVKLAEDSDRVKALSGGEIVQAPTSNS